MALESPSFTDSLAAEGPFPVAERFVSINGEGLRAGRLAAFVRMAGCNLDCSWCDTAWANEADCVVEDLDAGQLIDWVGASGCSCVTLTGGEPLLQPGIARLIGALCTSPSWGGQDERVVEVETNGSVGLACFAALRSSLEREASAGSAASRTVIAFTLDCKLPSSGMASRMDAGNYALIRSDDAVKFVVGSMEDLEAAVRVIRAEDLCSRCHVLFSPVFGSIDPVQIVRFMEEMRLTRVRLQLQMHKILWPDTDKGV